MADETPTSVLSQVLSTVKAALEGTSEGVAKALGVWTAARAAISTVASGVAAAATQQVVNEALAKYQDQPLTPAVLADMAIRNIVPYGTSTGQKPVLPNIQGHDIYQEAMYSGLTPSRFDAMVADTGESYGIIDALRLYNRNTNLWALAPGPNYSDGVPLYEGGQDLGKTYGITKEDLMTVIYYSRTRDQFVPDFLKLARNTISPADCVEMVVKQIVPTEIGQNLYAAAGGIPEQFQALVDAAGDAAGVEAAVNLAAHGVISEGQLDQIVGMSRLNPRFYYLAHPYNGGAAPLQRKWLPIYEIRQAVVNGTMTEDEAVSRITAEGYDPADAQLFIQAVEMGQIGTAKAETEGMVLQDWEAGLISHDEATDALKALGEKDWAIPFILDTVMAKKVTAQRNAVVTRVRAAVLYNDVTPGQAETYLTALGWDGAAAKEVVNGWVIEAETPHELLSTAQIGKLLEDGNISPDFAVAYWQRRGYTLADAQLLLYIYPPGEKGKYTGGPTLPQAPTPAEPAPLPPGPSIEPITQTGPEK